jgi:hypothetical protein
MPAAAKIPLVKVQASKIQASQASHLKNLVIQNNLKSLEILISLKGVSNPERWANHRGHGQSYHSSEKV